MDLSISIEKFYDLPCHVYIKDKTGIYRDSNDYHCIDNGTKGTEFIGYSDFDVHAASCASLFKEKDEHIIKTGKSLSILEKVHFSKKFNNEKRFFAFTFKQPIHNQKMEIIGVMGFTYQLDADTKDINLLKATAEPDQEILSNRQMNCLLLLVQGKTAKQIAQILNLSFRTVEHHIEAIKNKYNCSNRSELITIALQLKQIRKLL